MSRFKMTGFAMALLLFTTVFGCLASAPSSDAPGTATSSAATSSPIATGNASTLHNVMAAETFLADIAQNVAGTRTKVTAIMPIGADPHEFEPTPSDIAKISNSDLLIISGTGFEESIEKILTQSSAKHQIIEASTGLTCRIAREGEMAEMSDADIIDAMCAAAADGPAEKVASSDDANGAVDLPGEAGLFTVSLTKQADGTYGGFMKYTTDETGTFWIATPAGKVSLKSPETSSTVEPTKSMALLCDGLAQAMIVPLEKEQPYVIALEGFPTNVVSLLIGPVGGHHHEQDPHFWLDPNHVIKYVANIRDGLSQADPAGASVYATNADNYIAQLKDLDSWITTQVSQIPPDRRLLVTNHESFGYFADRYGFKIVGTIVPSASTEASPSAQQVARLVDRIRATGAKAIFVETGTNPQMAQQVAKETGINVVTQLYTHSLSDSGGLVPTYIDMMKYDVQAIVDALK